MTTKSTVKSAALALLALLTLNPRLSTAFAQGSLTPPGPPGPVFKTLDQIEPRTPIASLPYTITNAGSYCLATNLSAAGNGITIASSDVSLDLNGFSLSGGPGGTGIYLSGSYHRIRVSNGTIRGWGTYGIDASSAGTGRDLAFDNLIISSNGFSANGRGIVTRQAMMTRCLVSGNAQSGIEAEGGTISDCVVRANGGHGIQLSRYALVRNCQVESNAVFGIYCTSSAKIVDCLACGNQVGIRTDTNAFISGCVANDNSSTGISVGAHSTVENCKANNNRFYGITPSGGCVISGNHVAGNGQGGTTGGILLLSAGPISRVEGNFVRDNFGYGIFTSTGDIVLRNSSGSNTNSNFAPSSGVNFGPIQSPSTMTNAWGNISF